MTIEGLEEEAKKIRRDIIEMVHDAKSGHPGGSLSCTDILVALFHEKMNLNLDENGNRIDKFILSKGHCAPAYYAVLASKGFIAHDDLKSLRKIDSYLEGHPSNKINGVDVSSGSLGQGLSIANGMALAKKIDNTQGKVYCVLGDGEIEEGQIWEACMTASKYKLNNVIAFLDNNGLQIDGNIIGPKILGDSIGISAFWILFSILVAGELFGFIGMIIGVPLFAIIYSIIKENIEYKLKEKNLPTDTKDYM